MDRPAALAYYEMLVSTNLLAKTRELQPYFAVSYEYVAGTKPKATVKKAANRKKRAR